MADGSMPFATTGGGLEDVSLKKENDAAGKSTGAVFPSSGGGSGTLTIPSKPGIRCRHNRRSGAAADVDNSSDKGGGDSGISASSSPTRTSANDEDDNEYAAGTDRHRPETAYRQQQHATVGNNCDNNCCIVPTVACRQQQPENNNNIGSIVHASIALDVPSIVVHAAAACMAPSRNSSGPVQEMPSMHASNDDNDDSCRSSMHDTELLPNTFNTLLTPPSSHRHNVNRCRSCVAGTIQQHDNNASSSLSSSSSPFFTSRLSRHRKSEPAILSYAAALAQSAVSPYEAPAWLMAMHQQFCCLQAAYPSVSSPSIPAAVGSNNNSACEHQQSGTVESPVRVHNASRQQRSNSVASFSVDGRETTFFPDGATTLPCNNNNNIDFAFQFNNNCSSNNTARAAAACSPHTYTCSSVLDVVQNATKMQQISIDDDKNYATSSSVVRQAAAEQSTSTTSSDTKHEGKKDESFVLSQSTKHTGRKKSEEEEASLVAKADNRFSCDENDTSSVSSFFPTQKLLTNTATDAVTSSIQPPPAAMNVGANRRRHTITPVDADNISHFYAASRLLNDERERFSGSSDLNFKSTSISQLSSPTTSFLSPSFTPAMPSSTSITRTIVRKPTPKQALSGRKSVDSVNSTQSSPAKSPTKARRTWRKVFLAIRLHNNFCRAHFTAPVAGHRDSVRAGAEPGTILKRFDDNEWSCLKQLMGDPMLRPFVPQLLGLQKNKNAVVSVIDKSLTPTTEDPKPDVFIKMADLLYEFETPCVMDCKIGVRTYLEAELEKARKKPVARADMYQKMIAVDADAPTPDEHASQSVVKARYMMWREKISSTHSLGFRIEGMLLPGAASQRDFKKVQLRHQVKQAFDAFVRCLPSSAGAVMQSSSNVTPPLIASDNVDYVSTSGDSRLRQTAATTGQSKTNNDDAVMLDRHAYILGKYLTRLEQLRAALELSPFFVTHEMIGSSLLFVHDHSEANVWMIDFVNSTRLPPGVSITHRKEWQEGNHEDGYLTGLDNIIAIFTELYEQYAPADGNGNKSVSAPSSPLPSMPPLPSPMPSSPAAAVVAAALLDDHSGYAVPVTRL